MGQDFFDNCNGGVQFNRYTNLDNIESRIVMDLLNSKTKHAETIWKLLKYPDKDCLLKDNVSRREKINLIFTDVGNSSDARVFISPFIDDAATDQLSRLDVYVERIIPTNHIISQVNICFEIIVHNKINNITNNASEEELMTNPSELDEDGNPIILNKSRATTLLKSVLAEFDGKMVNGVGELQHNIQLNAYCRTTQYLWNNRAYFGYAVVFSTLMSGVSESPSQGY